MTGFDALGTAIELVRQLRVPLELLERRDRKLADQLRRAVQSIALNVAEGRGRKGGEKTQLWRYAHGSAEEAEAALVVAEALGYVTWNELVVPPETLDRLHAMLWRLSGR